MPVPRATSRIAIVGTSATIGHTSSAHSRPRVSIRPKAKELITPLMPEAANTRPTTAGSSSKRWRMIRGSTIAIIPWQRLPNVIENPSPRSVRLFHVYFTPAQASARTRPVVSIVPAGSGTPTSAAAAMPNATPMARSATGPPKMPTSAAAIGGPTMLAMT